MPRQMPKQIPVEQLSEDSRLLMDVINDQSDLACAVIGAAFLETTLGTLLERKFLVSSVAAKLLGASGALGSIAPRTDLAYCIGLISKDHYQDLCVIAEIRNRFAHSHLTVGFSNEGIRVSCDELKEWRILLQGQNEEPLIGATEDQLTRRARNQFNFTVVLVSSRLLLTTLGLRQAGD
jgi:DNA-binding MltR family transcriptional regulator